MLIGLTGYATVGKDEVADYLVKKYGFDKIAFAEPLRQMLFDLNPILSQSFALNLNELITYRVQECIEKLGYNETKRAFPEYRELLQRLGTECLRKQFGNDILTDLAIKKAKASKRAVISDVRMPFEVLRIIDEGGRIYRIIRPSVKAVNSHVTDTAIDNVPIHDIIENDGTIQDLHQKIDNIMQEELFPADISEVEEVGWPGREI